MYRLSFLSNGMPRKVILIGDPGIDTAFAIAVALSDPGLEVIGLLPCAGNVSAQRATANVQLLVDRLDPPKWPRTASALPIEYEQDGTALHGPDGLGGLNLPIMERHQQLPADKVLVELLQAYPREVSILCLGPATTLATTLTRAPELAGLANQIVMIGGTWKEPGNAGPVTEFHFALDPESMRSCLQAGLHPLILPLDVTRRLILSPSELLELPNSGSRTCQFLRQIVPYGIRASSHLYGIEGFHLKDLLAVAAVSLPGSVTAIEARVDIETRGELTRGMMVVDRRRGAGPVNARIGVDVAIGEIRQYIERVLSIAP